MTNFQEHKNDKDSWVSPPVYTHHQGYKMCLRVDAYGRGAGKGTHVSVSVHLMKGEYDDLLKWPFSGVVSIQLLDQIKGLDHIKAKVNINDSCSYALRSRVTKGETAGKGLGQSQFIPHCDLKPMYLQKDTLLFLILKVELRC